MRKKAEIMGIVNITPDSFWDGGKYFETKTAVQHVLRMVREGANIIDVGGESSGPGSKFVSTDEEMRRVVPVVRAIRKACNKRVSVDTYKSTVAYGALQEGATIVNDVTALRGDPNMVHIVAKTECKIILMYSKDSTARTTGKKVRYKDVIRTVGDFLEERIAFALNNGVKRSHIILDPGMGAFVSGMPKYSFEIIARLDELKKRFEMPILVGASRKSFLSGTLKERLQAGIAAACLAYTNGATIIRTHDVTPTRRALDTTYNILHETQ